MVRGFFASAAAAVLMLSGAAQVQAQSKYPSGKEFFPAVYGAVAEVLPKAKYLDIDFYNNSFTLTGVTGGNVGGWFSFDLAIALKDDGSIDFKHSNIYMKGAGANEWKTATSFGFFFKPQKLYDDLRTRMVQAAGSDSSYDRLKKDALSDVEFVYAILQGFTELAFNDFRKNYIADSVFTIRGRVSDVEEFGKEINGKTYKYLVSLTQDLTDESANAYFTGLRSKYLFCRFYTNQDSVIRMSKTATATVKGKAVEVRRSSNGMALYLTEEE
jgi:hypothetical protein